MDDQQGSVPIRRNLPSSPGSGAIQGLPPSQKSTPPPPPVPPRPPAPPVPPKPSVPMAPPIISSPAPASASPEPVVRQSLPALSQPTPPTAGIPTSEVVIRTMKDDMADVKSGRKPPETHQEPAPVTVTPTAVSTGAATSPERRVFPLPPRDATQKQKVVLAPVPVRRKKRGCLFALLVLFLLLILGGGGAAVWFLLLAPGGSLVTTPAATAVSAQLLPAETLVIAQYRFITAQDRTDAQTAWNVRGSTPTLADTLAGDPRLFIADPAITELYYIILEDSAEPFLLVPKTATSTQVMTAGGDARFVERDGWYVAHPISIDPYLAALTTKTLAAIGEPDLLRDTTTGATLRLIVSAGMVPSVRKNVAGENFLSGQLQELSLALRRSTPRKLEISGRAILFNPLLPTTTNQQLLSLVPGSASLVRLGANFNDDLTKWRAVAGVIDESVLNRPVVKQLLEQLSAPYAFFEFPHATGNPALGLVIELPPALHGKVTLSEPSLSEGLAAIVPLILDRRTVAPLSFTEVPYGNTALRYANIVGTTQALDYAVTPTYLLVATSKESMLALLETVAGRAPSVETSTSWQSLFSAWGALPSAHDLVVGKVSVPTLLKLLPAATGTAELPFGLVIQSDVTQPKVQGVILLPETTPSVSSVPTPIQ